MNNRVNMIFYNLLFIMTFLVTVSSLENETTTISSDQVFEDDKNSQKDTLVQEQQIQSQDKPQVSNTNSEGIMKASSTYSNRKEEQQNFSDDRIQNFKETELKNFEPEAASQESSSEEEEMDPDIDSYGIFMKNFYETILVDKYTIMMTHFGDYVLNTMDFDHVQEGSSSVTYKKKVERFNHPTYAEIFSGMYTNYTIMSSMLSLKACTIYYGDLSKEIANKCSQYLKYFKSFLEVYTVADLFKKNALKNNKIEVPPEYVAKDIVKKLMETKEKLDEALNQNFSFIVEDLRETLEKETIDPNEITINKPSEGPVYKPHESLDRAFTAIWEMLLDPVKENFIIFHNYFNDAMNIDHFIESIEDFVLLPESRPFLTTAWKNLVISDKSLKDTNFASLVFHAVRLIEINRVQSNLPLDEDGNVNVTLPETLYTLVDVAVPRKEETRNSNFHVVV